MRSLRSESLTPTELVIHNEKNEEKAPKYEQPQNLRQISNNQRTEMNLFNECK